MHLLENLVEVLFMKWCYKMPQLFIINNLNKISRFININHKFNNKKVFNNS